MSSCPKFFKPKCKMPIRTEEDLMLSKSGFTAMVLVLTTRISMYQIHYVWGLMMPFTVLSFLQGLILFLPEGCYARTRWIPAPNEVDKGDQQFEDPGISQIGRSLLLSAYHASLKMLLLLYGSFAEIIVSHLCHLVNVAMMCTVCCDFMVFFCLL